MQPLFMSHVRTQTCTWNEGCSCLEKFSNLVTYVGDRCHRELHSFPFCCAQQCWHQMYLDCVCGHYTVTPCLFCIRLIPICRRLRKMFYFSSPKSVNWLLTTPKNTSYKVGKTVLQSWLTKNRDIFRRPKMKPSFLTIFYKVQYWCCRKFRK